MFNVRGLKFEVVSNWKNSIFVSMPRLKPQTLNLEPRKRIS